MTRWLISFVVVLVCMTCLLNFTAQAQSAGGCVIPVSCGFYSFYNMTCVPSLPQGAFNCVPDPTIGQQCLMVSAACPPPAPKEPCPHCPAAGRPISLATGDTYIEQTDVRIPGLSNGLTLVRTWNSQWPSTQSAFQVGLFGPNWRSTYEERVFVGSDNYIKYARSDGSFWSFGWSNYGYWILAAPQNVSATLTSGSTYWTVKFQNGEQRRFDNTSGSLIAIIDRNGNTTSLTYDALNRLTTVTDPASRHLTFTYASSSSYLVTGVSSDVGISLVYSYDTQNRLSQVTMPDLSTISFTYNSQSLITSVTDSQGKILESHSYDSSGRGLTSSRAGGVDAVTVTYQNP